MTICFKSLKPIQIGLCMLMFLSILHHGLHLDTQYGHWSDMTSVDTIIQWREDWSSASVVNHTIVIDPSVRQPGFDLTRHTLLNRFQCDIARSPSWHLYWTKTKVKAMSCKLAQMGCRPITFLWLWPESDHKPHCRQVPINKRCKDGLNLLHKVGDDTVISLESTATVALAKSMNPSPSPFPPVDIVSAMMIVWRIKEKNVSLYCLLQSCTTIRTHRWAVLKDQCWVLI